MKKLNESNGKHDGKHSTKPCKGNNSKMVDTVDKILYLNYSKGEQASMTPICKNFILVGS